MTLEAKFSFRTVDKLADFNQKPVTAKIAQYRDRASLKIPLDLSLFLTHLRIPHWWLDEMMESISQKENQNPVKIVKPTVAEQR